jgi:hypothetical protein
VWSGGASGIGQSHEGRRLRVGHARGNWTPEQLLLLGAESSLMESFIAAAEHADLGVLGYVSSGHLVVPDDPGAPPRLLLKPCVVVASADDADRALRLAQVVIRESIAGRLLGDHIQIGVDVRPETLA